MIELLKEEKICKKVILDCKKLHTFNNFMDEVSKKLEFPEYFGKNWSAFNDSFKEKLWEYEDTFLLIFINSDELFIKGSNDDMNGLLETYIKEETENLKVIFI